MVSTRLQSTTGGDSSPEYRSTRHGHGSELAPYTGPPPPAPPASPPVSNTHFLVMPSECLEKIFGYLGYKKVSQLRLVCKQLDRVCSAILNSTFQKLQTQMLTRFQSIKAKMPRRESARRNHPLACESDIVETLHMRLTLLQMSFGKHIERKHVCFFAGEILDEVYRILHYIRVTPKLARPYKVTDELFDLSTMAMEYFKEHIEPTLPEIAYFGTDFLEFTGNNKYLSLDSPPHGIGKGDESPTTNQSEERTPQANNSVVLRKRIRKLKQGMKRYNYQLSQMRKELRCCRSKVNDQQKQMMEYASRLDDYDKKTEESNRKFSTMLQELNKCKTELQYWRSKSPLTACGGCGQVVVGGPPEPAQGELQAALVMQDPAMPGPSGTPPAPPAQLDSVWPPFPQAGGSNGNTGERLKRKGVASEKPQGQPPTKKRTVLKSRTKRL